MRLIFIGQDLAGGICLKRLLKEGVRIPLIITRPDYQQERGNMVKDLASEYNILYYQPKDINGHEMVEKFRGAEPEIIFVAWYGQKLPKEILQIPPKGCINFHPSLLPKYRGATPVNWAIINGETETGITAHYMEEEFDTGEIILQRKVAIFDDDTAGSLMEKLACLASEMMVEVLELLKKETIVSTAQDKIKVTTYPKRAKRHALIDWSKSAKEIHNLIRGMNPYPLAYSFYNGIKIKFLKSSIAKKRIRASFSPGQIVEIAGGGEVLISTGSKEYILAKELQRDGSISANFIQGNIFHKEDDMIEGKRVMLRKLEEEDLSQTLNWINDPEIAHLVGIDQPISKDEQKKWYQGLIEDQTKRVFAIELKEDKKHIGNVSLDTIDWRNKNARLTIFIGENSLRNQGFGHDTLTTFLNYCFGHLNLNKVFLIVHKENQPAIALYEKCGFVREGLLGSHEYYNGRYIDKVMMGILKSDFENKK